MSDTITLLRADALHIREVLLVWRRFAIPEDIAALAALDAALAEPPAKREPATDALRRWANTDDGPPKTKWQGGYDAARRWVREVALPALAEPPATREPATREQALAQFGRGTKNEWWEFRDGWQAAERWHGIRKEDKT